ncbi:MAG: 5-formyltetrahydrofolate cyclo-ligase [Nitrososphaeraceae archaeon]
MMEATDISSTYSIKNKIRQQILQKRNALSKSEISRRSEVIQNRIINSSEYKSARVIGAYFSIGSEVRTEHIISTALKNQKVLLLPKTGVDQIAFYQVFEADFRENKLVEGRFRILEPPRSSRDIEENIDLLIIPGIAFDKYGYRIGYGKGYYDRFIEHNECPFSIGLGFQFQLMNHSLPHSRFDQRLNAIATESNMLVC